MAVIAHATTSLDGYLAGPGDDMTWVFATMSPDPVAEEVMNTTGAILSGRRSYDIGRRDSQEAFGGAYTGTQLVLTHQPLPADDTSVERVTGTVAEAVALGLERAGEGHLLVIGGQVTRQVLAAGLLDEVVMHLAPVVLGDGVPFLDSTSMSRAKLHPYHVSRPGNVVTVRYQVGHA